MASRTLVVSTLNVIAWNVLAYWIALPAALLGLGLAADRLLALSPVTGPVRLAGAVPMALGAGLVAHAAILLRLRGKGLPISALPPTALVTSGPYRWLRHPIYVGYALAALGAGLALGSAGTAFVAVPAVAALWFATWVRLKEEPELSRRFGNAWRIHRDRTPLVLPLPLGAIARSAALALYRTWAPVRLEGREHLPRTGPYVLVSDHLSYDDFVLAQLISPRRAIVPTTAEAFRTPLAAAALGLLGGVPKRRFGHDPEAAGRLSDEIRAGGVVGIAVEGERSWTSDLGPLAPGVARNLASLGAPVVPVAFVGAYRRWPRWAGSPDRTTPVTIRIGAPFAPEGPEDALAARVRERILALRDPGEASVDVERYRDARPEVALWRCPLCRAEEALALEGGRFLFCARCPARWDGRGGDLTLVAPPERAGERDTLAGWARRADLGTFDLAGRADPVLESDRVEWREDEDALRTLEPLRVVGTGTARVGRERIEWRSADAERTIALGAVRTVTTERRDVLQLGVERGVVQLVLERASAPRWQRGLVALLSARSRATACS